MSREITFDLVLQSSCDDIDDFSEGVEFSYRTLSDSDSGPWIPLRFFSATSNITEPFIELLEKEPDSDTFTLRGYRVPHTVQSNISNSSYSVTICGISFNGEFQFRWLHTSYQRNNAIEDVVMLDNINVRARNCNSTFSGNLLTDDFDGEERLNR